MEDADSLKAWKALHEAARDFRDTKCWLWMWDTDLFAVEDPETGEIGYCCVIGRLGEVTGLAVYRGSEGLQSYLRMQSEELSGEDADPSLIPKCLLASFEDRELLQKQDLDVIKKLNLTFRGRGQWPLFRSYEPGYFPWYLTAEEVTYLTLMLRQAKEVSIRFRENGELLTPHARGLYFVRRAERRGGELQWKDTWMEPKPFERKESPAVPIDRLRLERIGATATIKEMSWETDFFYLPVPVREGKERPYYPYALVWVDHNTGFILRCHTTTPEECFKEYIGQFLDLIEDLKLIPSDILVRREPVVELFKPVAAELGIQLKCIESLRTIEDFRKNLREAMPKNKRES